MMTRADVLNVPDWRKLRETTHSTLLGALDRLELFGASVGECRAMSPQAFVAERLGVLPQSGGLNWNCRPEDMDDHLRRLMLYRIEELQFDAAKALCEIINASNEDGLREVYPEDVFHYSAWILSCKNRDYGASVYSPGAFTPYLEPTAAALVRLGDKFQRLKTLSTQDASVNESVADTILDVIGYCTILIGMNMEGYSTPE